MPWVEQVLGHSCDQAPADTLALVRFEQVDGVDLATVGRTALPCRAGAGEADYRPGAGLGDKVARGGAGRGQLVFPPRLPHRIGAARHLLGRYFAGVGRPPGSDVDSRNGSRVGRAGRSDADIHRCRQSAKQLSRRESAARGAGRPRSSAPGCRRPPRWCARRTAPAAAARRSGGRR